METSYPSIDTSIAEHQEVQRTKWINTCTELHDSWKVIDTWINADDYQNESYKSVEYNKKRTAWFTSVFDIAYQVSRSGILSIADTEHLKTSRKELFDLFTRQREQGTNEYVAAALPIVEDFARTYGDVDNSTGILTLVAVQLAKDPSGRLAADILLAAAAQHDAQATRICDNFSVVEVQTHAKFNIRKQCSEELVTALATVARDGDIDELRELMGNRVELIAAGDALLEFIIAKLRTV